MFHKILVLISLSFLSPLKASDIPEDIRATQSRLVTFLAHEVVQNFQGQDVHQFNLKIAAFGPFLLKCNKHFGFTTKISTKDILNELTTARIGYDFEPDFDIEINRLRTFLQAGLDKDTETNMYVSYILDGIWGYIQQQDGNKQRIALSELFYYLKQNTKLGGGCFPGYVGRLMLANLLFINREIVRQIG